MCLASYNEGDYYVVIRLLLSPILIIQNFTFIEFYVLMLAINYSQNSIRERNELAINYISSFIHIYKTVRIFPVFDTFKICPYICRWYPIGLLSVGCDP